MSRRPDLPADTRGGPGRSVQWLSELKENKDATMTNAHNYYGTSSIRHSSHLYNVGRLRTDIWHFLRDSARRLRRIQRTPDTPTTKCG